MQKSYTIKGPRGESSPGPPSHFRAWGGGRGGVGGRWGGGFDLINQALGFDLGRKKHLLSQEELQLATLAFVKKHEPLKLLHGLWGNGLSFESRLGADLPLSKALPFASELEEPGLQEAATKRDEAKRIWVWLKRIHWGTTVLFVTFFQLGALGNLSASFLKP